MFMKPKIVREVDLVFPARVVDMLPPYDDETKKYYVDRKNIWTRFIDSWFYSGVKQEISDRLKPVEGIDKKEALRHLQVCLGSFEPQHEHKIGGCARLLKDWFGNSVPEVK